MKNKKIIITGGPTNEFIDEVMKITNMSTGSLSLALGELFQGEGWQVCLILNKSVNAKHLFERGTNISVREVETTEEMLKALEEERLSGPCHALIHAAAVGDYKADFSFLMEDLAEEIFAAKDQISSPEALLRIMENPKCKLNDSSKISSYQKNLTVKLSLTPKIIARLREWYPDSILIGCKLLESVPKEELYDVAARLCQKNKMDYILANDLADLRNGKSARYLVTKDGYSGQKLENPAAIFEFVKGL